MNYLSFFIVLLCTTITLAHPVDHLKRTSATGNCIYIRANEGQTIDTVRSLKDGQWTDSTIWSVGRVPTGNDVVFLVHTVTIASGVAATVQGLLYNANGHLSFEDVNAKLQFYPQAQLRLKTVQSGTAVTTYTYDSQNRLSTIGKSDGSLNVLSYDDAGKKYINFSEYPNAADQTTGYVTQYPYILDGTSFTTYRYYIPYNSKNAAFYYGFDANKRLTSYNKGDGSDNVTSTQGSKYTYAGDNIDSVASFIGRNRLQGSFYQYDNKINPYFGLLDFNISPVQRFSRNNMIKSDGYLDNSRIYEYDYNQQNLPIKRTTKQVSNGEVTSVTTYSYESY